MTVLLADDNTMPSLLLPTPFSRDRISSSFERPRTHAKFLCIGQQRLYVRGTTYGAFAPNRDGDQFPEPIETMRDFALMNAAGINTLLTYTVPPLWLLDLAQDHGLRVLVTIPWMEYVCFLENAATRRQVVREVREGVAACRRHPAVLMYCIGKEIPPPIVRWHGAKKTERFLRDLCAVAKDVDPEGLVTYTNFPTTEYLDLSFVDVCTFNVYLHDRPAFCAYLSRLQHLAGERPLLMTEVGMCSFRHGGDGQARFLDWQIEEVFDHGLAGVIVFGWTDPFYQDHCQIEDWGFGLVDADRNPKPSYDIVQSRFSDAVPFSPSRQWPRISVVVAFHNAAATLEDCLRSLVDLTYPDYEVIVIDDGSTDASGEIMRRFSFRHISSPTNQGISAARNLGCRAATGEIVAYIDSDARADPEWLSYLAATYLESDVSGVGGPNLVPPEDAWLAQCVYRSPGGPTQVMLDDRLAEHIPGCNMSFRKEALEQVGLFDEQFRKAADDVDICWRLLERGFTIGFNPSATVWHHRRPSVKAYWRQQVGYGESEALLERKFPSKFNAWGHAFWGGRIYAPYPFFRLFGRPVVYEGLWGSAPFQPMYDAGGGGFLTYLPRAMEWHLGVGVMAVAGVASSWALLVALIGFAYTATYCIGCALAANVENLSRRDGPPTLGRRLKWRATLAWLNFLEPIARDWGRLKGGLTPWRSTLVPLSTRPVSRWWQRLQPFWRRVSWTHSGGPSLDKFPFLRELTTTLTARNCAVGWNGNADHWDLKVRRGVLGEAQVHMVIEHHGGLKRLARLSMVVQPARTIYWLQFGVAALAAIAIARHALPSLLLTLGALLLTWLAPILEANCLELTVQGACGEVARELSPSTASEAQT
jgi:GT2 family glycosyltransferase